MDKLTAIKIKHDDGTYSDEIPVSVLAENVEWDNTHTLVDVLGSIDVDVTGTIQDQISQLFNEKVNSSEIATLESRVDNLIKLEPGSTTGDAELMDIRVGTDGNTYNSAGTAIRAQVSELKGDIGEILNDASQFHDVTPFGNFYNAKRTLIGKDIISSTGVIVDNPLYCVSDKIIMDFTRAITIHNSYYKHVYCYDVNDNYLGRCDTSKISDTIYNRFPNTAYFRITSKVDDNIEIIMVTYDNIDTRTFVPYLPVDGLISKSMSLKKMGFVKKSNNYGNLFDRSTCFENSDLISNIGAIVDYNGAFVSDIIPVDGSRKLFISGTTSTGTHQYAYCYDSNYKWLGRTDCVNGTVLGEVFPTVKFIRVIGRNVDDKIIVCYDQMKEFEKYNPVGDYIKQFIEESKTTKIRVCTFNCGNFTGKGFERGSEEAIKVHRELVKEANADLIGTQDDTSDFGNGLSKYDSVFGMYKYYSETGTGNYNYKSFVGNMRIDNVSKVYYTNPSVSFGHPWFLVGTVTIDNKVILVASIHVDWYDKINRQRQLTQIKEYCDRYEYAIVLGDFNPEDYINQVKQSDNLTYKEDLKIFTDYGYKSANAGYFGEFNTILDNPSIPVSPFDNIVVSSNIYIQNVETIVKPWMNDHALLFADICIY